MLSVERQEGSQFVNVLCVVKNTQYGAVKNLRVLVFIKCG